jgi:hypothetical protein
MKKEIWLFFGLLAVILAPTSGSDQQARKFLLHDLADQQNAEFQEQQKQAKLMGWSSHANQSSSRLLSTSSSHSNSENTQLSLQEMQSHFDRYYAKYPRKCGSNWQEEYSKFHKEKLNSSNKKMLVAIPNLSGMADRIVGLVTTFMVAFLTDRVFQIGERSPLPHMDVAFTSPYINWTRPEDEAWLIEPLNHKAKIRNYNDSVLSSKKYFAVNTIDDWKLQDKFLRQDLNQLMGEDAETTFLVINRGKTVRMFENTHHSDKLKKTGLTSATAFGCMVAYLLQPRLENFQLVPSDVFTKMTDPTENVLKIAIQIRAGDWYLENTKHEINIHQYSAYFNCAKQIGEFALKDSSDGSKSPYSSVLWYLVTDSLPLREAAIKAYGESYKIVTSLQSVIEHSSKEQSVCQGKQCVSSEAGVKTAAAEWWLMKFARYHVITEYSGYGRSAAMTSLFPKSIYTIEHNKASRDITCNPNTFTPLDDLPYYWSGV